MLPRRHGEHRDFRYIFFLRVLCASVVLAPWLWLASEAALLAKWPCPS